MNSMPFKKINENVFNELNIIKYLYTLQLLKDSKVGKECDEIIKKK